MRSNHPVSATRHGSATPFVLMGLIAVTLVGVGAYFLLSTGDDAAVIEPIMVPVEEGEFVSQVLDQGEVQSSENAEIRCEVRARNGELSVLTVVPEGSRVSAGDFLVQLDSAAFEKELEAQNIALVNAQTRVIQAESDLESAKATLNEYLKGTYVESELTFINELNDAENAITTAKQKMDQAKQTLEYSQKLIAKGYITQQALETNRMELDRAEIELQKGKNQKELAQTKLEVLRTITKQKNEVQFEADIKAATVKLDSERKALSVEEETLAEIEEMIEKCRIAVPEGMAGQVVYAKEQSRGGNDWVLEEGTTVRQNQVLIRLPNPEEMEVKALINEQSITQIEPNMPCTIKVDALNNVTLKGIVTKVNQYAESSGWMSSSVRKYAALVRILDPPPALKPGMNASVTIQVAYKPNVLMAPIQTVYAVQDKKYVLLKNGKEWETRDVEVGGENSQMVYFTGGVKEGERLVMNPGAYKDQLQLPEAEIDNRIELPEGTETVEPVSTRPGGPGVDGPSDGRSGGGASGGQSQMPKSGAEMVSSKDSDGDGKLSSDEVGEPYSRFFDRMDSDSDGLLTAAEIDSMLKRMRQGGGGGGMGGPGGRQQ